MSTSTFESLSLQFWAPVEGLWEMEMVERGVGTTEGIEDGAAEGTEEGRDVGATEGTEDGRCVGTTDGTGEISFGGNMDSDVGFVVGEVVGADVQSGLFPLKVTLKDENSTFELGLAHLAKATSPSILRANPPE